MATSHADIPGRGPDPAYHARIRNWWTGLGNPLFPGQAPPAVEEQYLAEHSDESTDSEKK